MLEKGKGAAEEGNKETKTWRLETMGERGFTCVKGSVFVCENN